MNFFKCIVISLFCLFIVFPLHSQNHVQRGGFENPIGCPTNPDQMTLVPDWYLPTAGSANFFHACAPVPTGANMPKNPFGFQNARTGEGMGGAWMYFGGFVFREYLGSPICPMVPGRLYHVEFYVNLIGASSIAIDAMGIFFSTYQFMDPGAVDLGYITPHIENPSGNFLSDTSGWMRIGGDFIADSAYAYIVIGNFATDAETGILNLGPGSSPYYFVDDVSVTTKLFVQDQPDTTICFGDSVQLNAIGGTTYAWNASPTLSDTTISNPIAWPTVTTQYIVNVSDGACVSAQDTITITVTPAFSVSADTSICSGESTQLAANGGSTYSWSPSAGLDDTTSSNPVASPNTTTKYMVTIIDTVCGMSQEFVTVTIDTIPDINIPYADTTIDKGNSIVLEVSGGKFYLWSPSEGLSCTSCQNPIAAPSQTTTYYVIGTDGKGCQTPDSVLIIVNEVKALIIVPNAFTPNGDGMNDLFFVRTIGEIDAYNLKIYNRWGEAVFYSKDILDIWDGTYKNGILPASTYVYYISGVDDFGNSILEKGTITLLR